MYFGVQKNAIELGPWSLKDVLACPGGAPVHLGMIWRVRISNYGGTGQGGHLAHLLKCTFECHSTLTRTHFLSKGTYIKYVNASGEGGSWKSVCSKEVV